MEEGKGRESPTPNNGEDNEGNRRRRRGNVAQIARTQIAHEEGLSLQDKFMKRLTNEKGLPAKNKAKIKQLLNLHTERILASSAGARHDSGDIIGNSHYDSDFFKHLSDSRQRRLSEDLLLEEFEEMERLRNNHRPPDQRLRNTVVKLNAWHQKKLLQRALRLAAESPVVSWLFSFYQTDPRYQIMKFFDEVAREGGEVPMDECMMTSPLQSLLCKASVFSVWRPTSDEAIKNMMLGHATGKMPYLFVGECCLHNIYLMPSILQSKNR